MFITFSGMRYQLNLREEQRFVYMFLYCTNDKQILFFHPV